MKEESKQKPYDIKILVDKENPYDLKVQGYIHPAVAINVREYETDDEDVKEALIKALKEILEID